MLRIGLFASALLFGIGVFAQNVEIGEAKKIAENYLLMQKINADKSALTVSEDYTKYSESGEILYYIFNFESGGFVIVSGDKRANPILAFSTTNTFSVDKNRPSYLFIEGYEKEVEYIKTTIASTDISPQWNDITAKKQHKANDVEVGPLLTCKWNQDKYYNTLCPDDNTTGGQNVAGTPAYDYHVPNGCVALAMAQIMYYHRSPRVGKGSSSYNASGYGYLSVNHATTTYDYESMADEATGYSDALARLIYHAGVSVKMGYAPDGSGAFTQDVPNALMSKFLYKSSMKSIPRDTNSWWKDTIIQCLDKKLPIYYAARSNTGGGIVHAAGHAFVCDGYYINNSPADTFFHFNFGWGGNDDGFYNINAINPSPYNFIVDNRIIIDIEPSGDTINFFTGQKILTATYGSFNDGSGRFDYRPNTNCSWLISPQNGRNISSITLKTSSLALAEGDTVKIYRGKNAIEDSLVAILTDTVLKTNDKYTVVLPSSEALVIFTSDNSGNDEGFTFSYTSTKMSPNYCVPATPTRITTISGSIDNGSGNAVYNSDNTCYWAIAPEGMGNTIRFAFSKFDLEKGDVLEVFAHPATNVPAVPGAATATWNSFGDKGIVRYSIDKKPILNEIISVPIQPVSGHSGVTLLFRFRTDNNLEGTGFRIYWDTIVGIQDYNNFGLTNLSIYPNPANGVVFVDLYTNTEENIQISLYDVLGRNLYSVSTQQVLGQYIERISVDGYAKGLYTLRISTSKGTVVRKIAVE